MNPETRSQAKRRRERQADKAKRWQGIERTLDTAEAGREANVDTYTQEPTSCVCGAFRFAHYRDGHCILCPCGKYQSKEHTS